MQVHDDAGVAAFEVFLFVGVAQQREDHSLHAERRLDDIGDVFFVGRGVEIFEALAARLHMRFEVVVGAVGDAPQLAPAERELELEVGRRIGVERKLFGVVVAEFEVLLLDAQPEQPLLAEVFPIVEPLEVGAGLAEEFKLHLFELADAEDEVAGRDLVAEALADLTDAERHFETGSALDVEEVDKDALSGLRAQVQRADSVLGDALEGLEHQVELSDAGEVALAADGAGDLVIGDVFFHLGVVPAGDALLNALALHIVLDEVVGAVTGLAALAVHQGVGEASDVAACDPYVGVHQDRAVDAGVERIFLHEFLPPRALDVVFELDAERTVVPCVGEPAVDLAAGEDEASALAEGDEFVHCELTHDKSFLLRIRAHEFVA